MKNREHIKFSIHFCIIHLHFTGGTHLWGEMAQEVRAVRLAVGGLPVRSHPGRVEVSLSKTPNPQLLLMSWLGSCMAANRHWCVSVCVNEKH